MTACVSVNATPRPISLSAPERARIRTIQGPTTAQIPQQHSCHASIRTKECPCVHMEKYVCSVLTSARKIAANAPTALIHIVETRRSERSDDIVRSLL